MKKIGSIFVCLFAMCLLMGVLSACGEKQPDRSGIPLSDEDLFLLEQYESRSDPATPYDFEDNMVEVILRSAYDDLKEIRFQDFSAVYEVAGIVSIEYSYNPYKKITKWYDMLKLPTTQSHHMFYLELNIHDKEKVLEACAVLRQLDMVLVAIPHFHRIAVDLWVPSDTLYDEQWALNGTCGIQAEQAWDYTRGNTDTKVGIFEGGADLSHEDLRGRISQGNLSSMSNDIDHGTHVAGIIGAMQNDYGIAGIAATSIYVLDRNSLSTSLEYAEAQGIRVVNASFAYINSSDNSYAKYYEDDYEAISKFNGILICAAGNEKNNNDVNKLYPACYDLPNVISVGSIDMFGERSSFSNYGANSVDLYAPGGNILSTFPEGRCTGEIVQTDSGSHLKCECRKEIDNNVEKWVRSTIHVADGYHIMSGTSMAAPQVTGVAAMLLSMEPTLSPSRIKDIIISTADDITIDTPSGTQNVKRLNAYKAMDYVDQPVNLLFAGGSGTEKDPFLIENETQFRNIAYAHRPVYVTYQGYVEQINYSFKLMNDIVLQGDWNPFEYTFTGKLDGNNHRITYNMTISQGELSNNYFGLFRFASEHSKFCDLQLLDCTIKSEEEGMTPPPDGARIGTLAGSIYKGSELKNVQVSNPIIEIDIEGSSVGGIVGSIDYTYVDACIVSGGSITNYSDYTGGFAGIGDMVTFNQGSISTTIYYTDGDMAGPVLGNSSESFGVNIQGETLEPMGGCLAEGTLITLADGSEVPVEQLTGEEMLLVWNMYTGEFDVAPILFIDYEPAKTYRVIELSFSDGTSVNVVYEHGFWDYDLNKYVYLDKNAAEYLGHWFEKSETDENGLFVHERVQLIGVEIEEYQTAVYSPITYGHFCYFVNGMLSMPGGIGGMFNIFEVDPETMQYDAAAMQADIKEYGLFSYAEFSEIVPVSEDVFKAFQGEYLKVAIGKGYITEERLTMLAHRYAEQLGEIN